MKKSIKILKESNRLKSNELTLNQLNCVVGGCDIEGVCINYDVTIIGECLIVNCGLKWGCVGKKR